MKLDPKLAKEILYEHPRVKIGRRRTPNRKVLLSFRVDRGRYVYHYAYHATKGWRNWRELAL
jgi:hypothetical protein